MENRFTLGGRSRTPHWRSIMQIGICMGLATYLPAASAAVGDVPFRVRSEAAIVHLGCNGATPTLYNDVDPVYADTNGSNRISGDGISGNACPSLLAPRGQQIYSYDHVDDEAYAQDDSSDDYGEANSQTEGVSFLGGVLTYDRGQEDAICRETDIVRCTANTTITNLKFEGRYITGEYGQKQVIPASGLALQLNNAACNGLSSFTGSLTINDYAVSGDHKTVDFYPLALDGTLTCLGLPLSTVEVHIKDWAEILNGTEFQGPVSIPIDMTTSLSRLAQ